MIWIYLFHYRCFTINTNWLISNYTASWTQPPETELQLLLQPFNGLFSRTTWVSRYQKGKTNLDFTGARDSEWQWHQLGHMHVCTSLQTDNHASTPPLCFLQAGCPSCHPTNSVKALKAHTGNRRTTENLNRRERESTSWQDVVPGYWRT